MGTIIGRRAAKRETGGSYLGGIHVFVSRAFAPREGWKRRWGVVSGTT